LLPARDAIARTWPASIDDTAARRDWGWRHKHGIDDLVTQMLEDLSAQYQKNGSAAQQPLQAAPLQGSTVAAAAAA
jgi:hypothetical protein